MDDLHEIDDPRVRHGYLLLNLDTAPLVLDAIYFDGRSARARIAYRGDPGNRATLRILCESGLALAFDGDKLPGAPGRGGVLTPATALGEALVPRLRAAGFEISVGE